MKKRIVFVSLLTAMLLACITGCSAGKSSGQNSQSAPVEPVITTTTDTAAVSKLLPSLEGVTDFEAEQLKYGENDNPRELPDQVSFKYHGYITLSKEAAEKYANAYDDFTEADPSVSFEQVQQREGNWLYSPKMCKDLLGPGIFGDIWMSGNVILFDLGTS
ncbi:MAG: hypothetical protein K5739_09470 [Lachnospiraceae bacterium]|nr:hypothetical protein [Lachnospiraceae bacterium]